MKIRDNLRKLREWSLICLNNQKGKKTNDIIKLKQFIFFREKPSCGSDSIWIQVERHKATYNNYYWSNWKKKKNWKYLKYSFYKSKFYNFKVML